MIRSCTLTIGGQNFVITQLLSSVKEIEGLKDLKLAPNPNQGKFQVSFDLATVRTVKIMCYNNVGQQIYTADKGKVSGLVEESIDLQKVNRGVYWVVILIDNEKITKPIVINN